MKTDITASAADELSGFLDHLKAFNWSQVAKGLLFDAGPNATRFLMLGAGGVVGLCLLILTCCCGWVYLRTGHIEATLATLIGSIVVTVAGFVGTSLNFNKVDGTAPHHEDHEPV